MHFEVYPYVSVESEVKVNRDQGLLLLPGSLWALPFPLTSAFATDLLQGTDWDTPVPNLGSVREMMPQCDKAPCPGAGTLEGGGFTSKSPWLSSAAFPELLLCNITVTEVWAVETQRSPGSGGALSVRVVWSQLPPSGTFLGIRAFSL